MAITEKRKYGSNESRDENKKDIKQIAAGSVTVRKKDPVQKFMKRFFKADLRSIKDYIFEYEIIPGLQEIALRAFEMLLFGETTRSSSSSNKKKRRDDGWTQKKDYSNPGSLTRGSKGKSDRRSNSRFIEDIDDIYFETRGDAEKTLAYLNYLMEEYDEVSVADFYETCNKTPDWALNSVGWTDLDGVTIRRNRYGYYLDLPRIESLD